MIEDLAVPERKLPSLTSVACLIFFVSLLFAIFTGRSLYSDGSYYFMRALEAGGFADIIPSRSYAGYLFDLPMMIALKLGITNISELRIGFGIGCFIAWPLAMVICHRLSAKHFWLVMLACGAGYLNAAFMAVGEHIVAHAFFWPACFAILFVRPLTPLAGAALLGSSFILLRSYESMLFLGPPLAALALWRAATSREKIWQQTILFISAAMFVMSAYIALGGILHPYTKTGMGSFRNGIVNQMADPCWTVGWSYLWVLLMIASWSPQIKKLISRPITLLLCAGIIVLWSVWPLVSPARLDPSRQYEARFLNLMVPFVLLIIAFIISRRPGWIEAQWRSLTNLSAALLLAQSLWHIAATEQWRGYLHVWEALLASHRGVVNLADTPYGQSPAVGWQATRFVWPMDARDLSIEISPIKIKSIIQPAVKIDGELADQFKPQNLPRLARYGVDYGEYLNACAQAEKQ